MYIPSIFTSVSLVVNDLTLCFQTYKLPELLKKGNEDISMRADGSGLSNVSKQVKCLLLDDSLMIS